MKITKSFSVLFLLIFLMSLFSPAGISETASPSPSPKTSSSPAPKISEKLKELSIFDFEQGENLKNSLGGESGSWNLDPTDENNSYTDADIVVLPGKDG